MLKAAASYELPLAIHVRVRYVWQSGWPDGRLITVKGLSQGSQAVLAQPRGAYELPALNNLQVRLDKDITVRGREKFRLSADITNLFNASTPLNVQNNSTQTGVAFGAPLVTVLPRQATLGIRYSFWFTRGACTLHRVVPSDRECREMNHELLAGDGGWNGQESKPA